VDPKDIQRSPEEESAVNYNNSCKKKKQIIARKFGAKVVCRECVDARRARARRSSYHGNVPGRSLCPVRCCP
jgi:hypothetical protein